MLELARSLVKSASLPLLNDVHLEVYVELDVQALMKLGPAARKGVYRGAARAVKPVKQDIVDNATWLARYGFLAKAIGTKIKIYGGSRIVALVGPKMSFVRTKGKRTRGAHKGEAVRHRPYLYSWLLERGTYRSRKLPFIAPAKKTADEQFAATVVASVAEALAAVKG